jgi:CRISPR/Cas system CSM-associated protein Csm2 small subunit
MADFNIRTDAVDVEQIMRQIRARIQSKRGVDYTEEQIQELANVKLERFLDPKGVRSDLVEQFKRARDRKLEPFSPEQYEVDADDLYGSSRGLIRLVRKILNPILKLMLNTNRLVQVLHQQSVMNKLYEQQFHQIREKSQQRDDVDVLYYELVHNLVLELTRVGIENRNLKMRLESLSSRMDFDERRARALETVVQYRPGTGPAREPRASRPKPPQDDRPYQPQTAGASPSQQPAPAPIEQPQAAVAGAGTDDQPSVDSNTARRRRRRRRGRRGGRGRTPGESMSAGAEISSPEDSPTPPHGDPTADAASDESPETDFDDGPAEDVLSRDDSGEEPDPSAR